LEVTFLLTGKEIHLQENASSVSGHCGGFVWGKHSLSSHVSAHECVRAQPYVWTQGSDQRLHSDMAALQDPNVHHLERLQ